MIQKGSCKISISKLNHRRIQQVKKAMSAADPELYPADETISNNAAIEWMYAEILRYRMHPA
jgi:hypothetical protein